nr:single-stranded DNA-binding protein [bacterium]
MSTRSLNKVQLIGNLTRDPNLRYTPNSTAVCSFSIATNRTWTPADGGEKQEKVEYHNIVAWSKLADICGQLLHKGDKVYVEGR